MKRLTSIVINSEEFNTEDKINLLTICADYRTRWAREKARRLLSAMEVEKPYTCRDVLNAAGRPEFAPYQEVSNNFATLVRIGVIRREKVKTGRVLEIDNPKYANIYYDIKWFEDYLARPNTDYISREVALSRLANLNKQLLETPKTLSIEETITYYYRTF